jgi:hypothetical protein
VDYLNRRAYGAHFRGIGHVGLKHFFQFVFNCSRDPLMQVRWLGFDNDVVVLAKDVSR